MRKDTEEYYALRFKVLHTLLLESQSPTSQKIAKKVKEKYGEAIKALK